MNVTKKTTDSIQTLDKSHLSQILDVLCDAFYDYPVMKEVIGPVGKHYDSHLRHLIKLFVTKRIMRGGPILGILREGELVACVTITTPYETSNNKRFAKVEKSIWAKLDPKAKKRYENLCYLWREFEVEEPHYHINMIGVRSSWKSQGLGSRLIEAVHQISSEDSNSCGVTLTTENPKNIAFYKHHGYNVEAHFVFSEELETWCFFRRDKDT